MRGFFAPKGEEVTVEYEEYVIRPISRREGSQWLTAGVISKRFAGEVKEHHFVRADAHSTKAGAFEFSITKAKEIIDLEGERLFREGSGDGGS